MTKGDEFLEVRSGFLPRLTRASGLGWRGGRKGSGLAGFYLTMIDGRALPMYGVRSINTPSKMEGLGSGSEELAGPEKAASFDDYVDDYFPYSAQGGPHYKPPPVNCSPKPECLMWGGCLVMRRSRRL